MREMERCAAAPEKEMKKLMNRFKKILAGILAAAMVITISAPVMADEAKPQVFVNFICGQNTTGKYVPAGSNVTAPAVPLLSGYTFCGFDRSLMNVTANTTYTAIYVPDSTGAEAIQAKKASLPTPAVSATTVADPNAAGAVPAAAPAPAAANTAGAQTALTSLMQAQQAAANAGATVAKAASDAAQVTPAQITAAADEAAKAATAAVNAQQPAPAATPAPAAAPAPAVTATGLPGWAVSLHGVDANGCAEVYKYWKTVKNTDDATIQGNWDALLNHYAGHGTQGW